MGALLRAITGGLALLGALAVAPAARAEELRPALNASLILNLLARPAELPGASARERVQDLPATRAGGEWQPLPDGSYRYASGSLQVIIKNPCPEGSGHTPVALPGRRR